MKPVRLPASATLALPRWGLISLCLLYILPGLIRRDPWKTDDVAGFGIMWTMAHGGLQDWLLPNIAGMSMPIMVAEQAIDQAVTHLIVGDDAASAAAAERARHAYRRKGADIMASHVDDWLTAARQLRRK